MVDKADEEYIKYLETVNERLENKLEEYDEKFNDLRSKIKDLLDGVEY